jgi:hypothetical protein
MTIKSKKAMTTMLVSAFLLITYFTYVFFLGSQKAETLKSLAIVILIFIGISVISQIIIQILFHIVLAIGISKKEGESDTNNIDRTISFSMIEDEMDKLIGFKSLKINFVCVGVGFLTSLVLLLFGGSATVMIHILYLSFVIGSIASGGVSIYFYERGFQNG